MTYNQYHYLDVHASKEYSSGAVTETDGSIRKYIRITEYKNSQDTGSFKPGEYQVKPYSVASTRHNMNSEVIQASMLTTYTDTSWIYQTCSIKGEILTQFLHQCVTKPLPDTSAYKQLALQKAKSKVAGADLDLGETLGEYKETIQMLRNPLGELRKFLVSDRLRNWRLLLALAKKNRREVNRLLGRTGLASANTMASTWLELRYGLRPLVMLVQDVIDKVNEKRIALFDPNKIRSAKTQLIFSKSFDYDLSGPISSLYIETCLKVTDTVKVNACIQYRMDRDQSFLEQLGLTPRFLPETLWNLTRLSFVVDWIFSIGPWIGSLRWTPKVEILGNTVGVKITRKVEVTSARYRWNYYTQPWHYDLDKPSCTQTSYTRTCNEDLVYRPHFTWGRVLDLFKVIDSISLIWQLFLSKLTRRR